MDRLTCFIIGDPHFKVSNTKESTLFSERCINLAKEKQPDLIICLGDVLDRHETIHVNPLMQATKFLNELRLIAPTFTLIGNHDRCNNSNFLTDEHPFTALHCWENMTIVDKVLVKEIKGQKFVFVPYVPPGRFNEALATALLPNYISPMQSPAKLPNNSSPLSQSFGRSSSGRQFLQDWLTKTQPRKEFTKTQPREEFTKTQPREDPIRREEPRAICEKATDTKGTIDQVVSDSQDQVDQLFKTLTKPLSEVTAIFAHQEFCGAKMGAIVSVHGDKWPLTWPNVISGHIHEFDQLQPNLLYPGTPLQHAFGDRDDKTICWAEFSSGLINKATMLTEDPRWKLETSRLSLGLPLKRIVYLKCSEVSTYQPPENVQLKIVISGTPSELKAITKWACIKTFLAKGIKVSYKDIPETLEGQPMTLLGNRNYGQALYEMVIDNENLVDLFKELFGEVSVVLEKDSQNKPTIKPVDKPITKSIDKPVGKPEDSTKTTIKPITKKVEPVAPKVDQSSGQPSNQPSNQPSKPKPKLRLRTVIP